MKFKKVKKPKGLILGKANIPNLFINNKGCAEFSFGYEDFGPREAIKISRWLARYSRWSSLQ